ncbi:MAG TPA: vitamin K epoxide reductase family protein [Candidatus Angelobacter sp.]
MATERATKILTVLIVVFCLAGVIDASLALGEHYNTGTSPCDINTAWDCGEVNHSPYAVMRGIPVATIGIVGYALLAALAGRFPWITAAAALAAVIFSLRLTWIEWKVLKVWCIYCVRSQGIIVVVFLLAVAAAWLAKRKSV